MIINDWLITCNWGIESSIWLWNPFIAISNKKHSQDFESNAIASADIFYLVDNNETVLYNNLLLDAGILEAEKYHFVFTLQMFF